MKLFKLFKSREEQKREELARMLALADAAEHPIFKAVLDYADEHAMNEHQTALAPNLTNEQRQFNAGRSAAAYDFAATLRTIQGAAAMRAQREKRRE